MFIKRKMYLAPNFTTEDFRIQVRGHLANYVYGCHVTPVTRGTLGYASYQKGIIQGHLVHRYAPRKATVLCSRIVFWAVLSLDLSTQTVFLYYMSVKYTFKRYFWCFGVHVTYWLLCQTDEINTVLSTLHRLYIYIERDIICLLLLLLKRSKLKSFVRPWFNGCYTNRQAVRNWLYPQTSDKVRDVSLICG